jgi:hypothetical protein
VSLEQPSNLAALVWTPRASLSASITRSGVNIWTLPAITSPALSVELCRKVSIKPATGQITSGKMLPRGHHGCILAPSAGRVPPTASSCLEHLDAMPGALIWGMPRGLDTPGAFLFSPPIAFGHTKPLYSYQVNGPGGLEPGPLTQRAAAWQTRLSPRWATLPSSFIPP